MNWNYDIPAAPTLTDCLVSHVQRGQACVDIAFKSASGKWYLQYDINIVKPYAWCFLPDPAKRMLLDAI